MLCRAVCTRKLSSLHFAVAVVQSLLYLTYSFFFLVAQLSRASLIYGLLLLLLPFFFPFNFIHFSHTYFHWLLCRLLRCSAAILLSFFSSFSSYFFCFFVIVVVFLLLRSHRIHIFHFSYVGREQEAYSNVLNNPHA